MKYLDDAYVKGFTTLVEQQLTEAVEFSVDGRLRDGEHDPDELRQSAQDAIAEMMYPLVGAVQTAYRRSALQEPDYATIALLFNRLAIRARLVEIRQQATTDGVLPDIVLRTRGKTHSGQFYDLLPKNGDNLYVHMGDEQETDGEAWVPVDSILELHA